MSAPSDKLQVLAAIFVGAAVSSSVIGRAATGAILGVAVFIAMICLVQNRWVRALINDMRTHPLFVPLVFSALLCLPSHFASIDLEKSVTTHLRTVVFVLMTLPVWYVVSQKQAATLVAVKVGIASSLVLTLIALAAIFIDADFLTILRANLIGDENVVRALKETALSAVITIPLFVWATFRLVGPWRLVALLTVGSMAALIFALENRSAVAGFIASACVIGGVSAFRVQDRRLKLIVAMATAILIFIVFIWLSTLWIEQNRLLENYNWRIPIWLIDAPRQEIWAYAIQLSKQAPTFGFGINTIDLLPGSADSNPITLHKNIPLHPHNWALEVLVETGWIGFGGVLCSIFGFLLLFIKRTLASTAAFPSSLMLLGSWVAYWISGLFSISIWSSWLLTTFLAVTAIGMAIVTLEQKPAQKTTE